ncbi:MAG: VanW family protein [Microgenomates group bacterium GW2011_GWC1_39_7b]|uniref:VanW family protein n=3 Tax=Candidatus Woeseibacteriota TaxID=1752722 RepID=A0A0G0P246_9BACT|nr:MAG: VanW family protein [Candidatus Woesebacteria bacterium GW2011_GWB1_39_10]KKR26771.1 MAG: VanW family protein [Microgenomates group bacterium GW2011_GWC1_39_7b]KKR73595.1 MAG: VanW family protein [Candidatus Woesebacteria bacterium GW2011_GWA2_40_7]KKS91119.1 MAG: VanW family protein [Candidatus Woesebacteria bacterium GW2011_GWA1_43_12]
MQKLRLATPLMVVLSIFLGIFSVYNFKFTDKIYPNTFVEKFNLGGLNVSGASVLLSSKVSPPEKLVLTDGTQSFEIKTKDIDLSYDFTSSALRAYNLTRTGNIFLDLGKRIDLLTNPVSLGLATNLNETKLTKIMSVIAGQDFVEPLPPSIKVVNGKVEVFTGKAGTEIDQQGLRAEIGISLSYAKEGQIVIPVKKIDTSLTKKEEEEVRTLAQKFVGKKIIINFESNQFALKDTDILKFLNPKGGLNDEAVNSNLGSIASQINRSPQNPKFNFDGRKVVEFLPALDGITVDTHAAREKIIDTFNLLATSDQLLISFDLPVVRKPPEVATDEVNTLGIKELIGRGTSTYYHSIPSRVHNVVLAASRINGTLVKPNETFSFNNTLGDISAFTGYQQAYIISGGKTILGDGGGVCQVSTTLFRAILNAGLPVTERTSHAYRVGYYEQSSPPGLDATVYGPSPDLKFINDTSNYILIEAFADPKRYSLVFELYGTNDGRIASISKPVVSNVIPALPTVYQDDPTLPIGTQKQIDYSAPGAKVSFIYLVKREGQTIYQKTFVSNYRPWAAVYLRGTATK